MSPVADLGAYGRLWLSIMGARQVSSTNTLPLLSSTGSLELPSPNWPRPFLHRAEVGIPPTAIPHPIYLDKAEESVSLPLGYNHCWTIRALLRLVCRLVELPGLASGARFAAGDRGSAVRLHVCGNA